MLLAATLSLTSSTVARPANVSPSATESPSHRSYSQKYEFSPSPIRVKQGTMVQLKITATDHAHGFRLKQLPDEAASKGNAGLVFSSPQDCQKIEKGQTATVEFVAQTPGTYPFKCCTRCGWHHRAMKGQLIVEP
jgi:heme/copper-type cytochrome/quinol oxidase subunit 2